MTDPKDAQEARRALGSRLAALRVAAGFTQVTFGKAIKHSRSTIANVETGMQNVQRDFWQRCDELLRPDDGSLAGEHDRILQLRQEHRRNLLLATFGDDEQPDDWTSWLRHTVLNRTAPPARRRRSPHWRRRCTPATPPTRARNTASSAACRRSSDSLSCSSATHPHPTCHDSLG